MKMQYTDEKQTQVLIFLLKAHGIRRVIASPGTTNMALIGSIQYDSYFEIYSSVDERSAAYMACGIAAETGEPVALSCTGATASRNYLPGLTEAFYRKLPVLAITSHQGQHKVGHLTAQVIDRSSLPNDVTRLSVNLPNVKDDEDLWDCEIKVNKALLELKRYGGGPVHINLPTSYSSNFDVKYLPEYRAIYRINGNDIYPELTKGRIAIFVGAHRKFSDEEIFVIDSFCAKHNSIVFCDHTSNYRGKYRILSPVLASQEKLYLTEMHIDLLIHIGEISGDYFSVLTLRPKQVWRVNEDGEVRDLFRRLRYVFEMTNANFFNYYAEKCVSHNISDSYLHSLQNKIMDVYDKLSSVPFSNIWIASKLAHLIPSGSTIHFAILNSLRSWNFFELPETVTVSSNVGGFGIDGCMSSLVGASLINKEKLYFCVIGDLAFFYDMNVLGNRHIGNNIRILIVNNGKGQEFKNFNHPASLLNEEADVYIAAGGHFGNKSRTVVKCFINSLGFEYLSASCKDEFEKTYGRFILNEITDRPMLFEVFTDETDESNALKMFINTAESVSGKAKEVVKRFIGENHIRSIKKILRH